MNHALPWLGYLQAEDVGRDAVDFDGMNVESPSGEHLGVIEGFIVDTDSGRPYYVVVDSSGWFHSRHFLLPVGHVQLDAGSEVLIADLNRDRIEQFPGFNLDEFDRLTADDLKRLNDAICQVCGLSASALERSAGEPYSAAWDRPDYRMPEWWVPPTARPSAGTSGRHTGREHR